MKRLTNLLIVLLVLIFTVNSFAVLPTSERKRAEIFMVINYCWEFFQFHGLSEQKSLGNAGLATIIKYPELTVFETSVILAEGIDKNWNDTFPLEEVRAQIMVTSAFQGAQPDMDQIADFCGTGKYSNMNTTQLCQLYKEYFPSIKSEKINIVFFLRSFTFTDTQRKLILNTYASQASRIYNNFNSLEADGGYYKDLFINFLAIYKNDQKATLSYMETEALTNSSPSMTSGYLILLSFFGDKLSGEILNETFNSRFPNDKKFKQVALTAKLLCATK
jgi:hypothetical protein